MVAFLIADLLSPFQYLASQNVGPLSQCSVSSGKV